ncbi:unnamed protein product [Strongylus vulgaris]|uniref:G-protein coupled receptors family 1 profile domain-containing protein n=1 Tax=Strongylus vulgaris TaxID=40348 RepID=A0A3P7J5I4_STRVU|nr:unnamed protein product [Strongylus vulgaris]
MQHPDKRKSNGSNAEPARKLFCVFVSNGTIAYSIHEIWNIESFRTWFGNRENPFSSVYRSIISLCVLIYALAMIILPIILLTMLNLMLLRNNENQMQKTEHRVTLTVTFIVTMFTLTNGPSALMHLIRTTYSLQQQDLYDLTMICR